MLISKKSLVVSFTCAMLTLLIFIACETKKDPFSNLNSSPNIEIFAFDNDSLKYTGFPPFDVAKLNLKFSDNDGQPITATFRFISGGGRILHPDFTEISRNETSVTFDVPTSFNSEASQNGAVTFVPDTTGIVEIELSITDQVKTGAKIISTFFFRNINPRANFEANINSSVAPYLVSFDASGSVDRDAGEVIQYTWDFGDDSTASVQSKTIEHSYLESGTYLVKLLVEDNDGGVDSIEVSITTMNQLPLAILQVTPQTGAAPLQIGYTATNSNDPDGRIVSYRVDFDDGASSLDSAGTHTFTLDDNYRIRLLIQDNLGATDTTAVTVQVATAPVALLNVTPSGGSFPLSAILDGTNSYDPQGGQLDHDLYINGALVYDNIDSVAHNFDEPGTYLVRLVATNRRNGLTSEAFESVEARNDPPVANFNWDPPMPQNLVPVTYTSTSIDPNATDGIAYYKWTFPLGVIVEGETNSVVVQTYDAGIDTYRVKLEVWDQYRGTIYEGYNSVTKIIPRGFFKMDSKAIKEDNEQ